MYTFAVAEQVSLTLLVAYYSSHMLHRVRAAWYRVRREMNHFKTTKRSRFAMASIIIAFGLNSCVEASPVVFYGLHLGAGLIS